MGADEVEMVTAFWQKLSGWRFTIVTRRCTCSSLLGLALWPWSDEWFVVSHGLCRSCYNAMDEEEEEEAA